MTTDDTRSPLVSFDDAMRAARQAYWAEVRSLAEDVINEARDNATSGDWTDEDDLRTYIHESIDGHAWVIYTARAQMVCLASDNDGAGMEEGLVDPASFKDGIPWSQLAYCAMERDLYEHLDALNFDPNDVESWKATVEE
jgi:hypothetical protein